jgi:uncharacterized protein
MRTKASPHQTIRQPTWQRVILLGVLGYEGIGALLGGSLLVGAPDGRLMDMPVEIMHGFFPDFLIPGLILLGLGMLNTVAFVAVWRRARTAWLLAGLGLGGLTIWFIAEIAILRELHWLHAMWGLPVLVGGAMALSLLPSRTEMRDMIKRHPVATYFALTYAISWATMLVIVFGQGGIPTTREAFTSQVGLMIPVVLGGPSLGAILATALVSGKAGFGELFAGLRRWRVGVGWYAVALLTAPLVFGVVHAVLSLTSPVFLPGLVTTSDKVAFLLMGMVAAIFSVSFEELGWTGFAIPHLRRRYGVVAVGLIMGVLWAGWHLPFLQVWPVVAMAGDQPVGAFLATGSFLLLVGQLPAYRVLMIWVYDHTQSLLLAILMHWALTASTFVLGPAWVAGSDSLGYSAALSAAWWLVVGAVALVNRGQLARRSRLADIGAKWSGMDHAFQSRRHA